MLSTGIIRVAISLLYIYIMLFFLKDFLFVLLVSKLGIDTFFVQITMTKNCHFKISLFFYFILDI